MNKEPRLFNYLENKHENMTCCWLGFMINKFPTALPHISRLKNTTLLDNTKNSFPGGSVVKNPPSNAGDMGSIPGLGSSPGKGNGNPLQYSCLENAMDKGDWWGYSPWGGKRFRHDLETKQHNKHSTTLKTIPCCCCCCCFLKKLSLVKIQNCPQPRAGSVSERQQRDGRGNFPLWHG